MTRVRADGVVRADTADPIDGVVQADTGDHTAGVVQADAGDHLDGVVEADTGDHQIRGRHIPLASGVTACWAGQRTLAVRTSW